MPVFLKNRDSESGALPTVNLCWQKFQFNLDINVNILGIIWES